MVFNAKYMNSNFYSIKKNTIKIFRIYIKNLNDQIKKKFKYTKNPKISTLYIKLY